LLKLLLKENENYEGEILFDNLSLKKIKKKSYLRHAGVVLQDTEVFNFTLRDNITIASPKNRKKEDLVNALEIAHVDDFAHKLPRGLDTFIGEKGIKLSGGERQRLGIARAVYKQPELLFLDEATSHLDLESEEKIKDSLHRVFQKVTAVVIAHRLTTIREMDKILVIEKGKIIESGSFDELYTSKGRLYELWEKQKF
jgi:subfamily B ATP-binding cassette protein MsbA